MRFLFYLHYRIRQILPEKLKRLLRAIQLAVVSPPQKSPCIPQHLLNGCKFLSCREDMLHHLPKESVGCEIGVLYGSFSQKILDICAPSELHLLDIDFSKLKQNVRSNSSVHLHRGLSHEIMTSFPDNYFDWIYVDGDHSYQGIKKDIESSYPKLKIGGLLIFNDFGRIVRTTLGTFGVHQAVCELAVEKELPFAYFCFEGEALYDVALMKPI